MKISCVVAAAMAAFFLAGGISEDARAGWVAAADGIIPPDAVPSGSEAGKPLYICRADTRGGIHPGKIRHGLKACHIGYGGRELSVASYEVLTAQWASAANGEIPPGAFVGGDEDGQPIVVCRASYQRGIEPGKIRKGLSGCNIGYGGKEVTVPSYQVLVGVAGPGSTQWTKASNGAIPADALAAGREGTNDMYVCQADHDGGVHTGKIRRGFDGCYIGLGGQEVHVPSYGVLTMNWAADVPDVVAVAGGNDGEPLYLCRAQHQGGVHPGKTRQELGGCHIGWGGAEVTVPTYTILVDHAR